MNNIHQISQNFFSQNQNEHEQQCFTQNLLFKQTNPIEKKYISTKYKKPIIKSNLSNNHPDSGKVTQNSKSNLKSLSRKNMALKIQEQQQNSTTSPINDKLIMDNNMYQNFNENKLKYLNENQVCFSNQNSTYLIQDETTKDTQGLCFQQLRSTSQSKDQKNENTIFQFLQQKENEENGQNNDKQVEQDKILSKETQDILDMLDWGQEEREDQKQEKNQIEEKELRINKIQNSVSLREKYSELLSDNKQFQMPYRYNRLLRCMEQGDIMLNTFRIRRRAPFFDNLSIALEESCTTHFKVEELRMLLNLVPGCYVLTYERNDLKKGAYDLYIQLPQKQQGLLLEQFFKQRKQQLYQALLDNVKHHHQLFLDSISYPNIYDYSNNQWHPEFELHQLNHIPFADLPIKPVQLKDFFKANTNHNQESQQQIKSNNQQDYINSINKIVEKKNNQLTLSQSTQEFIERYKQMKKDEKNGKDVFDKVTGLSHEITNKIRQREMELKKQKEEEDLLREQVPNYDYKFKKEELKILVEMIHNIYLKRKVSNMAYSTLLETIVSSNHALTINKDEISKLINFLKDQFGQWLKFVDNQQLGKLVRIDRSCNLMNVFQQIDLI